jgi:hypothetical protein
MGSVEEVGPTVFLLVVSTGQVLLLPSASEMSVMAK